MNPNIWGSGYVLLFKDCHRRKSLGKLSSFEIPCYLDAALPKRGLAWASNSYLLDVLPVFDSNNSVKRVLLSPFNMRKWRLS